MDELICYQCDGEISGPSWIAANGAIYNIDEITPQNMVFCSAQCWKDQIDSHALHRPRTPDNGLTVLDVGRMAFHVWIDCPHCTGDACEACEGDGGSLVKVVSAESLIAKLTPTIDKLTAEKLGEPLEEK